MNTLKKLLADGLAVALPLGICFFIFREAIAKASDVLAPVVARFPVHPVLSTILLFIAAIVAVIIGLMVLGLLLKLPGVSWVRDLIEDIVVRLVPGLNQVKSLLAEKFSLPQASAHWMPVLLHTENKFHLGFLINESSTMATFFILKGNNMTAGEAETLAKETYAYQPITISQLSKYIKQYGAGMQELWKMPQP